MKVFITEFRVGSEIYEGPTITAENYEQAEEKAEAFDLIVVAMVDLALSDDDELSERVLH
jgi:hypothetical protein